MADDYYWKKVSTQYCGPNSDLEIRVFERALPHGVMILTISIYKMHSYDSVANVQQSMAFVPYEPSRERF